ncbi:MAG TPA: hypothetical protein VFO41_00720 [Alphaproteobacteria bacterium]|nr:hypothetical protein [Alphaproteobacteria bacterium]
MTDFIEVMDHDDRLRLGFEDVLKYHGRHSIGGAAIGFKMLQRAFELLSPDAPPRRGQFRFLTAFPGPGARDAVEFVTRAVTGGTYQVDLGCAPEDVPEAPKGRYYFHVGYANGSVDLGIRPGLVRPDFVALIRRKAAEGLTETEEARLVALKREMADRLLPLPAAEVFAVLD